MNGPLKGWRHTLNENLAIRLPTVAPGLVVFTGFIAEQTRRKTWQGRMTCREGDRSGPRGCCYTASRQCSEWGETPTRGWDHLMDGAHLGCSLFAPHSVAKSHNGNNNNKAKLPPGSCLQSSCLRAHRTSSIHHLRSALNNSILHDLLFIYAPIQYLFRQWRKWACCRIWSCEQNK